MEAKQFKNVFFIPYIGDKYEQGYHGKKVLVLGESHYCADDDGNTSIEDYPEWESLTNEVIESFKEYLRGNKEHSNWMRTFTKFSRAFNNGDLPEEQIIDFWDHVAFYNYVQVPMVAPRQSPTEEQFAKSEKAFGEILETYHPDIIIVWGQRLWTKLPYTGEYLPKENTLINNGKGLYYYKVKDKKIPAMYITHPSASSFHYQTVYDELKECFSL